MENLDPDVLKALLTTPHPGKNSVSPEGQIKAGATQYIKQASEKDIIMKKTCWHIVDTCISSCVCFSFDNNIKSGRKLIFFHFFDLISFALMVVAKPSTHATIKSFVPLLLLQEYHSCQFYIQVCKITVALFT